MPIRGRSEVRGIRLDSSVTRVVKTTANGKLQAISSVLNEAVGIEKVSQFGNAVIHHWRLDRLCTGEKVGNKGIPAVLYNLRVHYIYTRYPYMGSLSYTKIG